MSNVIKIENLSKKYLIGHQKRERYIALRDVMMHKMRGIGQRLRHPLMPNREAIDVEEFWALKDINLEIKQGDRVGIIGRNGAGKSTLLKVLSRITEPTNGRITLNGRVASLLEVGTGFHPELTGKENIFLNGAILGMSRADIKKNFDEIVAFAEVDKFLDTPVKRYSSGMYVRLAFAVAAHLEPEILVVDEVLAVGDAQFQKKCMGKMEEVGKEGRTVLFVSHNMNAIEQLCTSAIWLDNGVLRQYSQDVRKVIKDYLISGSDEAQASEWLNFGHQFENQWFKPLRFSLTDVHGVLLDMPVRNDDDIWVQIEADIKEIDPSLTIGYAIYSEDGTSLYWTYQTDECEERWPSLVKGVNRLRSNIPKRFINEGVYRVEMIGGLHHRTWLFEPGVHAPSVFLNIQGGLSDSPFWLAKRPGLFAPVMKWDKF